MRAIRVAITLCWNCGATGCVPQARVQLLRLMVSRINQRRAVPRIVAAIALGESSGENCRPAEVLDGMKFAAELEATRPGCRTNDGTGAKGDGSTIETSLSRSKSRPVWEDRIASGLSIARFRGQV